MFFSFRQTNHPFFFKKNKNRKFSDEMFGDLFFLRTFATRSRNNGAIAQLVEQRTENPCVPGSIPGGTTPKRNNI